jgi:phage-related protein
MVVSEAPSFERPSRKQTVYKVPGRNGAVIVQQDAWEDVGRSYKVWLTKDKDKDLVQYVNAVEAWLNSQNGYQRLEDSFEPDVFRLAYYSGGEGVSNILMQAGEATLRFTCRPERFLKEGEHAIVITDGSKIFNPTQFKSRPFIRIEGDGRLRALEFLVLRGSGIFHVLHQHDKPARRGVHPHLPERDAGGLQALGHHGSKLLFGTHQVERGDFLGPHLEG